MYRRYNIRLTPLTTTDLRIVCPAAFAEGPASTVSPRYNFASTAELITRLDEQGYHVVDARQAHASPKALTADSLAGTYVKHQITFAPKEAKNYRDPRSPGIDGLVHPRLVYTNSHNGTSAAHFSCELATLVCNNGLMMPLTGGEHLTRRHTGDWSVSDIAGIAEQFMVTVERGLAEAERWSRIALDNEAYGAFLRAAASLRWDLTKVYPNDFGRPYRAADYGNDLWRVFNRAQEALIQGGLPVYTRYNEGPATDVYNPGVEVQVARIRGVRRANPITSFETRRDLNLKLWSIAEKFALMN